MTSYVSMRKILTVVMVIILTACSPENEADPQGKITRIKGDVTLNGERAKIGDTLPDGAVVKTGRNALVEIVFKGKNIIRIFDESETVLNLSTPQRNIFLKRGALANVLKNLGRLAKREEYRFAVTTPTAVAGIRGTSFYVRVESSESTYVCDCNGRLEVADFEQKSKKQVAARHHQAYRVVHKNGQYGIQPAEMLYHTDKALEELAAVIGVMIDWEKIDTDP